MLVHMDGEICNVLKEITYIDEQMNIRTIKKEEGKFDYRSSLFKENKKYIIVSAEIKLEKGIKDKIKEKMNENMNTRKEKQPINYPSAGSVFKRNGDIIPAKLIDQCGLKGYNIGDAYVSEKHAGFIVNKGNASAKDILKLIDIIKEKVYKKFNVQIELEIEILGED